MKVRIIEDNDTLEAIQLMKKYTDGNGKFYGFEYNEAVWMRYFLNIVEQQRQNNPHYFAMIAHTKEHGGNHWRADSVRVKTDSNKYGKLLKRRYNAQIYASTRGIIGE